MAKKYAECNIVISPDVFMKPVRRRMATVNMEIMTSQGVGEIEPITLIIKGNNFQRVMELMTLHSQPDEEIAKVARNSVLADEIEGMTDEETAAWVRQNVIDELNEMGAQNDGE